MLSRVAVGVFSALLVALVFGALPLTQFLLRVIDALGGTLQLTGLPGAQEQPGA